MISHNMAVGIFLAGLTMMCLVLMLRGTKGRSRNRDRLPRNPARHEKWSSQPPPQTQPVQFRRLLESQQAVSAPAPTDHLALVAQSGFQIIPLLNRSEARLLPIMERIMAEIGQGHRVMAQVSMGEVLRATNADGQPDFNDPANRAINAKRLDFVIIDRRSLMVAAIEFQGGGHHLSDTAFIRDAVKRESLRKAGLHLIELPSDTDEHLLRAKIAECTALPVRVGRGAQRHRDQGR